MSLTLLTLKGTEGKELAWPLQEQNFGRPRKEEFKKEVVAVSSIRYISYNSIQVNTIIKRLMKLLTRLETETRISGTPKS